MKRFAIKIFFVAFIIGIFTGKVYSQQFVYTPINPAFGGSSFNSSWMLATAQAENKYTTSSYNNYYNSLYGTNSLDQFSQNLNNQILSQLSSKIIKSVFGEGNISEGHYELGKFIIDISPSNEGVHINILDNTNGNQTDIIVPFY